MYATTRSDNKQGRIVPGPIDVICGRGKKSKDHAGNARFHSTIRKHKDAYRAANTKDEKKMISLTALQELRSRSSSGDEPSRFLKLTSNDEWVDIGDNAAREKISQALREAINQRPPPVRPKKAARKIDEEKVERLLNAQKSIYMRLCKVEILDPCTDDDSGTCSDDSSLCEPPTKKQRSFETIYSTPEVASL
eukprot:CAMPEP_0197452376 /NCGR_PEP_ID=MMETSP1175-20131217/31901_1 /TAXON_ID=1003142 /ORGANISM="Triceratium dubium, Strain CCMP147" /LENGTH=192 /DNA_ID=CAMNT_0042985361 /DNA_START=32 /DNA_END=610 /DNA_ORIENTATION=+